ncbi:MAG TPA: hypothetical protein VEN81_02620 [Planctomycetota bacterium]|nr:hypothetical protein [Planctomycetota bacterium]
MKTRKSGFGILALVGVGLALALGVPEAYGQDHTAAFLQQTQATASQGWSLISSIGSVVIGGGALIGLASGMYQGKWGHAAISFVAGAAGLLTLWGFGKALGF